jgi:hypothetical protein
MPCLMPGTEDRAHTDRDHVVIKADDLGFEILRSTSSGADTYEKGDVTVVVTYEDGHVRNVERTPRTPGLFTPSREGAIAALEWKD